MFGGTAIIPTHVRARRKSKVVAGAGDTNCGGIGCWYGAGALAQLCWSMLKLILLIKGMGIWLLYCLLSMLTGFMNSGSAREFGETANWRRLERFALLGIAGFRIPALN